MRRLEKVSCSLNFGLIYSVDYSYSPENGVSITIFFVNESGEYSAPNLIPMQKASIKIGPASFSLYPKSYKISKASGRRVISVEFVDEMFKLNNYYITMTGRGSGQNIYQLGKVVDKRTIEQKLADALDPYAQKVKEFTQFEDLEHSFDEFINVLKKHFSVNVNASYDTQITRSVVGTFRDVLSDWCSFFNLAFYFENSRINIYDPTRLTINLPSKPSDAISYEISEDIEGTYGKTVVNYIELEGGEKELNENFSDSSSAPSSSSNSNNNSAGGSTSNTIKYISLYPIGYEFNLQQTTLDLKQVAAAMYGKEFWFLYNLANDTLPECGWTKTNTTYFGRNVAEVNEKVFNEKFNAYYNYGLSICGDWYLSSRVDDLTILMDTRWFSEAEGQVFKLDSELAEERATTPMYLEPPDFEINQIPETVINEYFPGVNFVGKRLAIRDTKNNGKIEAFTLTDEIKRLILLTYQGLLAAGSDSVNWNSIEGLSSNKNYASYASGFILNSGGVPTEINQLFEKINKGDMDVYFKPRYSYYPLKGIRMKDAINIKDLENQPEEAKPKIEIVRNDDGPSVVSNTSLIKVKKEGSYIVYYDKYSNSASSASVGDYFAHKFDIKRISTDNNIGYRFFKTGNTYQIQRDISFLNGLINNPYLPTLAQAKTKPTKTVSFSLNYFYDIPSNFLSNGLVGLQMSVSENGVNCTYTFSDSILRVPDRELDFQKYENNIKNSWIRTYRPKEVIS
jgi:hypothetical protein